MKSVLALLAVPLALAATGCSEQHLPAGTRLFLAGQPTAHTNQLSAKRDHPASPAFGWTIAAKGAVPKQNYVEVFAVTSGPMAGLVGTEPGFAGAPSHMIGYVALRPFRNSVKVVVTSAQRPGQLADGSKSDTREEAFGYAIANPTAS